MAKYIIGIDEAGRGPLAGPIVAAGIIFRGFPKEISILAKVKESKSISCRKREILFLEIIKNFIWSVAMLDNNFIDRYGIQKANTLIIQEVIEDLKKQINKPFTVRADYVGGADNIFGSISFFKKGDKNFKEIAAASIIAKVYRDKLMEAIAKSLPAYDFQKHKGYGTKKHFEVLGQIGLSAVHRQSFLKKLPII